jgi:hypothetical protein
MPKLTKAQQAEADRLAAMAKKSKTSIPRGTPFHKPPKGKLQPKPSNGWLKG